MPPSRSSATPARLTSFLRLEDRTVPAAVRFDYSFDTSGFFQNPERREALDRAAAQIAPAIHDSLAPIVAAGGNTWAASFVNPVTGQTQVVPNLVVNADEIVVYISAGAIGAAELGLATSGGYSASGTRAWLDTVRGRGQLGALATPKTDFSTWGGMVTFDSTTNWNFKAGLPAANEFDFQSVATHELMHLFGFGLGEPAFARHVVGGNFVGPNILAVAPHGVPVLGAEPDHFVPGTNYNGQASPMQPSLMAGDRRLMTALEYAVLADVGWETAQPAPIAPAVQEPIAPSIVESASPAPAPAYAPTPAFPPAPAVYTTPVVEALPPAPPAPVSESPPAPLKRAVIGVGTATSAVAVGDGGVTAWSAQPFGPEYTAGVRVATADVTGDGIPDVIAGSGPGQAAVVRVLDGSTGLAIATIRPFEADFTGGVYLAAADVTGDGRADVVVTPDQYGGPIVATFDGAALSGGRAVELSRFWGIKDPAFRGGLRPALGDLNGDGRPDLALAAGYGGGPRVSVLDGRTLTSSNPANLIPDFFAFEAELRNGAFVTFADLDGDNKLDLVAGAGPGGGPRVTAYEGAGLLAGARVPVANFFAGDPTGRGGVRVASADVTGDGRPDLITGTTTEAIAYTIKPAAGSPLIAPVVAAHLPLLGAADADGVFVG